MESEVASAMSQARALMDEYRQRCLWFLRLDYYPETPREAVRVLRSIEKHGDVAAFKKAANLRRWLSRIPSETSVG
jgi:hypothetical protein